MSEKPYRPSNGTEGMMFQEAWCNRCERDRGFREKSRDFEGCSILADAMVYMSDDSQYPKEWVYDPEAMKRDGYLTIGEGGARCTAFVPEKR